MITSNVIIVGGGPAGSTCAWKLREHGVEALILDKQDFPRSKPCAGWITPRVIRNIGLDIDAYPHSLTRFSRLHLYYRGGTLRLPTLQFAIRRLEFDHWLLERTGVPVHAHRVESISRLGEYFILDDTYRCRFLVGAGGTSCPVYRTFFKTINPRIQTSQIAALEVEYAADITDKACHLWFADDGLAGYSWFVPKSRGYVNIGIGGKIHVAITESQSIHLHWKKLIDKLLARSLISAPPPPPVGYTYYLRNNIRSVQSDNAFIIGDAAGLATKDMGEGIGPAIESGIRAADAIIYRTPYSIARIRKFSLWDILLPS